MSSRPELRLDWCSHEAARYAVENWHYSKRLPLPPLVRVGVWEGEQYIGCVLFARGANKDLGTPYGLTQLQACELVRVALRSHEWPVSRILSLSLRFLAKHCPGLRLIISFADPAHGHHGGIYQAGNWIYAGASKPELQFFHRGRWKHRREIVTTVTFGKSRPVIDSKRLPQRLVSGKHRYLMPLDPEMRAKVAPLARPYPKRAGRLASEAAATHADQGGATPTPALSPDR